MAPVRQLLPLQGSGGTSAGVVVLECCGGRALRRGKGVGALSGLPPPPQARGTSADELGLAKAGHRHSRALAIATAWGGRRFQPDSARAPWYQARGGQGRSRLRRLGMAARARQLLSALWRFWETGARPAGAALTTTGRRSARGSRPPRP
jgi:hypothetical protein